MEAVELVEGPVPDYQQEERLLLQPGGQEDREKNSGGISWSTLPSAVQC